MTKHPKAKEAVAVRAKTSPANNRNTSIELAAIYITVFGKEWEK
ncbi:MAG TPA: hypothetical protein PKD68_04145 [Candidatus Saccharibacteria bacterium]|nr:hypothetical protein [Candidatus Saccharibacteria bacterium]